MLSGVFPWSLISSLIRVSLWFFLLPMAALSTDSHLLNVVIGNVVPNIL